MKTEYRQRLPHIQPVGSAFFVTFSLFGSVPKKKVEELKERYTLKINQAKLLKDPYFRNLEIFTIRKQYLFEYDVLLDAINEGPNYLKDENIRNIITKELFKNDGLLYDLTAYCIMSNHVHILIDTSIQLSDISDDIGLDMKYVSLDIIMKKIKGPTAMYCNKYLNRSGQFWDRESYDIYIRNEKMLDNVCSYILQNPVKAGLVSKWDDFPGNYLMVL
ncbi:MAG: transposase [Saprospiraceae bacterium]|nr:transposase [Saprospiraceae bacterium]